MAKVLKIIASNLFLKYYRICNKIDEIPKPIRENFHQVNMSPFKVLN